MPIDTFGWLDVDLIGEKLAESFRGRDPLRVRFTELRALVESLPGFAPDPDHPVNEKILEAIQAEWYRIVTGGVKDED
ncbi:MAG: Fe-S cluster assembly protein IscX [Phycisphaerales bacterium]